MTHECALGSRCSSCCCFRVLHVHPLVCEVIKQSSPHPHMLSGYVFQVLSFSCSTCTSISIRYDETRAGHSSSNPRHTVRCAFDCRTPSDIRLPRCSTEVLPLLYRQSITTRKLVRGIVRVVFRLRFRFHHWSRKRSEGSVEGLCRMATVLGI